MNRRSGDRETARLTALRSCAVLDTRPEADFDDLTAIAAGVTGAGIAVVAFVDEERWWVKSRIGPVPQVVARDEVLCRTAFECGHELVIDDLDAYEFRPRTPEIGQNVRFYAALPLVVDDHYPVGVLCLGDAAPITLSPGQRASLDRIARQLVRLLAYRRHATLLAEAHEALAIGEAQYRLLADTAPDAIVTVDESGDIIFANPATAQLFGYAPGDVIGQPFTMLASPDDRERLTGQFRHYVQEGQGPLRLSCINARGAHRDGREVALEVSCGEGYAGSQRFFTAILRDVSDRRAAAQALVVAREQAEESSRLKSEFLANMSHEIRTPMNGVLGMLDLVLEESISPSQRSKLERARESAQALLGIIHDILDLSKIEAGRLELESKWVDPRAIVSAVIDLMRPLAEAKGLALDEACDAMPRRVLVDGGRLRQVLINLAGNAVKFTDRGCVSIRARATRAGAGRVALRFAVEDTGIGIPKDQIPRVFEKFIQLDGAAARRVGGTGLGLSICARLIELMGGRIDVTSEPGKGSVFVVDIELESSDAVPDELRQPRDPVLAAAGARPLTRHRVLVVEDNAVNQEFALAVLRSIDCDATLAVNGQEAVDRLLARAPGDLPDVILMDCQMPVMDGYEATRRLRAAGITVPVLALTANAMESDRERCLAAGMDDVLVKPVRPDALRAAVATLTAVRPAPVAAPAAPEAGGVPVAPPDAFALDEAAVLARVAGDRDLFFDVSRIFIDHSKTLLDAVTVAATARDGRALASAAHALKGSIGTFTQDGPYVTAATMEQQSTEGSLEAACALAPRLGDEVAALCTALERRLSAHELESAS